MKNLIKITKRISIFLLIFIFLYLLVYFEVISFKAFLNPTFRGYFIAFSTVLISFSILIYSIKCILSGKKLGLGLELSSLFISIWMVLFVFYTIPVLYLLTIDNLISVNFPKWINSFEELESIQAIFSSIIIISVCYYSFKKISLNKKK